MAFDYFNQDDQDQQEEQQQNGMVQVGPESGTLDAQNQKQTESGGGGGTTSGAFTNLQNYLDKNKSLNFGTQVSGKVQGAVDDATKAQQESESAFKSDVDKNTVTPNDELINEAKSAPTSVVGDEEKFSNFLRARDAEYKGPNNLVDTDYFNPAYRATTNAQEEATSSASEGGRKALLNKYYGSGNGRFDYTSGQQKLDNLLIQNDPNSRQAFQTVQGNASKAGTDFDTLKGALQSYAGQGKATTQAARAGARSAIGIDDAGNVLPTDDVRGNGAIQDRLENIDLAVAARQKALADEKAKLSPVQNQAWYSGLGENADYLGLQSGDYGGIDLRGTENRGSYAPYYEGYKVDPGYLYGANPGDSKFLNYVPEGDINRGTVGSSDDMAQLAALSQLAGTDQNWISNPQDAGKYSEGKLSSFDTGKFNEQVGQGRNEVQRRLQAVQDYFKGVQQSGGITDPGNELWYVNQVRKSAGLPEVSPQLARQPKGQIRSF